ncbi:MAG TPA: hypothetical protein VGS28_02930 [Candidatus Saccharimonadales bacterium]|nr:hypothetical protein [Candidatus Saccharimonadales bacterium]
MANPESSKEKKRWDFTGAVLLLGALAIGFGLMSHVLHLGPNKK